MKSIVAVKPTEEASPFIQMTMKANDEASRLQSQKRQIVLQLQANQAELQTLQAQAVAHEKERSIAEETVKTRRQSLTDAETHSKLAAGTLSEKTPDLKQLDKALKQAQHDQMIILDRIGKAEQAEERRRYALMEAIDRHNQTLAHLEEMIEAVERVKASINRDWGQAVYSARVQELANLKEALAAKEQEVHDLKETLDDMGKKALQSLKDWPSLAEQLSTDLLYEDTTTTTLEAAIALLDILLTRGHDVAPFDTVLLRSAGIPWGSIDNILSFGETAIADALYEARRSEPITLQEKKKNLTNLLKVYRAQKRSATLKTLYQEAI